MNRLLNIIIDKMQNFLKRKLLVEKTQSFTKELLIKGWKEACKKAKSSFFDFGPDREGIYYTKMQMDEENITKTPIYKMLRKGLMYIPQSRNCFDHLTVIENLKIGQGSFFRSHKNEKKRLQEVYDNIYTLKKLSKRIPYNLSGGERKLISVGQILMNKPKMIIMDEPFSGLDEDNQKIFWETIFNISDENDISLLIVEHDYQKIYDRFDRVFEIQNGTISN